MRGLYAVTPDWDDTDQLINTTELILKGGATLVQYRHKTASDLQRETQARELLKLCHEYHVPLVINDDVALCQRIDADGIHVGGQDMPLDEVRKAVGPHKIVGASCYGSIDLAIQASHQGASYVALGGFYPSVVKKYEVNTPVDLICRVKQTIPQPIVVIGGMTAINSQPLIEQGADMVAAISSIYKQPNPLEAAAQFTALFV